MGLDISAFQPMLKVYYSNRNVELKVYKDFPTLRLLSKKTDWTGDTYDMPIWYESSQAVGHDFADAKEGKDKGLYTKFVLTQSKFYGFAQLDRQVMKRSMGDKRSFLRAFSAEVDGVLSAMGRDLATKIFRTRASVRGRIGSIGNGDGTDDRVVLTNRQDVVHFAVGMGVLASDDGTAANLESATPLFIRRIDRSAGALYFTASRGSSTPADVTSAAGSWDPGDYLHRYGDVTASSDTLGIAGLEEWIPTATPGSTPFFGVNRTLDSDRLAGIRVDGDGFSTEDVLIEAGQRAFEAGAKPDHWVMNPLRFGNLMRELGSKVQRDDEVSQQIGVTAIKVHTQAGESVAYGDPYCPVDKVYGLTAKSWELVSTGPFPEIADEDLKMLRESDADAYEVRMVGYGQLGCHAPGENVVIHSL